MKLNRIAASISALAAASVFAYGPTVTPDYVVYAGGGAEQNLAFETIAKSLLVQDATLDTYTEVAAGTAGKVFRAVFGQLAAAHGAAPAGAKVLFVYRSNGGVFGNGIGPVLRPTQAASKIAYLQVLNNATATGNAWNSGKPTYRLTNASLTENRVPDIGLANEEVALFTGINLPAATAELTTAELSGVNKDPLYQVVNGIAVTNNLYAQKPNFTHTEIAAILAGNLTDWSQLNDASGNPLPAGPIYLIDRNAGSGAKAGANQYFLNNPGGKAFGGTVTPVNSSGDQGDTALAGGGSATYTVKTESSSGNVGPDLNTVQSKGLRGIGILGRENVPGGTDNWSFVSIDGVSAGVTSFDKTHVVDGTYDYFFTASIQTRKPNATNIAAFTANATATGGGSHYVGDGTAISDLILAFKAQAQNPAVTTTIPGTLLDPNIVNPGTTAYDAYITRGTRNGNSTAPVQLQF